MLTTISPLGLGTVLFLPPLVQTAALLFWPSSPTWINNIFLFAGSWSLYHFYARYLLQVFLTGRSSLFNKLPVCFKRQHTCVAVICTIDALMFFPMAIFLFWKLFSLGPNDFTELFGGLTRCLVALAVVGIVMEVVNKRNLSVSFLVHHTTGVILGSMMIDDNVRKFEPGSVLVAVGLFTASCAKLVVAVDHIGRGGEGDDLFTRRMLSSEMIRKLYFLGGCWSIFGVWVAPCTLVTIYIVMHGGEIELAVKIMLGGLLVVFGLSDITFIKAFFHRARSHTGAVV